MVPGCATTSGCSTSYLTVEAAILGTVLAPAGAFGQGRGLPLAAAVVVAVVVNLVEGAWPWLNTVPPLMNTGLAPVLGVPLLVMAAWGLLTGRVWTAAAVILTPAWLVLAASRFPLDPHQDLYVVLYPLVAGCLVGAWVVVATAPLAARVRLRRAGRVPGGPTEPGA